MVFPVVFALFSAFLVVGGLAYLSNAFATVGSGWLASGLKLLHASLSLAAAVVLVRAVPRVLQLPTREELEQRVSRQTADMFAANQQLRAEARQREQAEAEVRRLNTELEARLTEMQLLFNVLPVGVAIATDATCRTLRSNRAFADLFGLPAPDTSLTGAGFAAPDAFRVARDGRELRPDELPMLRAVLENRAVRDFEQTIARADGGTLDLIAHAVPIRDNGGRPCGCVATFQDMSSQKQGERKRLEFERKLLQSQKLESIGVLAGGIAHDFNNLLTGILGHANFARGELSRGSNQIDPLLAQVEVSAQRAAELCRQLLAYAGKGRFVVRLTDLNVAVKQTVPLLNLSITKKTTLDLQLSEALPPFRADPTQINQVLMNLVTNASEAIGVAPGTITVRTDRVNLTAMDMLTLGAGSEMAPGGYVCLEVRDSGCGITPEAISHIFEPFFTTKFVGRGLGLAAVLGIVQGHRGGIRVSSQVGAGSSFELFFPIASGNTRDSHPSSTSAPANRGTVLVVDDDDAIRSFVDRVLVSAGYSVVCAVDGEEALIKLRGDPVQFDAVLLDLTMPKLDGEDTLMALRMLAPNLPVVLTSGYSEQTIAQRFVGRGLADFLPKPFLTDALLSSIATAISRVHANN
jgi:signal transduction histidine kinase/ActR/RegA family two-component response regulator